VIITVAALIWAVVLVGAFLAWQLKSLYDDLDRAESAVDRLRASIEDDDRDAQDRALADLQDAADDASGRVSAFWFDPLTWVPGLGDDAEGVQVISTSLSDLAAEGLEPLVDSRDGLDTVLSDGRFDIELVRSLQEPVARAGAAFDNAEEQIGDVDSSGFTASLKTRFDEYADAVADASQALDSAGSAIDVLPGILGADGPRTYLLLFQNNAEIRTGGGMPGAWAVIRAEDGVLDMDRQGTSVAFKHRPQPVLPLTDEEKAVFGKNLGRSFQRVNSSPDFPRVAELVQAHWDRRFQKKSLDGVLTIDPVAISYLLDAVGSVQVNERTLTSENLVAEILNEPYLRLGGLGQNVFFKRAARTIFDTTLGDLSSPLDLLDGMQRAASEGRFQVASFDPDVQTQLEGTDVEGAFRTESTSNPYVDIGVDAANATKMSYYLHYDADVEPVLCPGGRQRLAGTMTLQHAISDAKAAELPTSITGTVDSPRERVQVRIYGPVGGTLDDVLLDDEPVIAASEDFEGRPVVTVPVLLDSSVQHRITWTMQAGLGQTGDVRLRMTPGIRPAANTHTFASACE
jgi:hypothetical protein